MPHMINICDLMPKSNHVTIKIPKELIEKIDRLVGKEGFRSRGEIAKVALRNLLDSYKELITPVLEHFNLDEDGVKIHDRTIHEYVNVAFKPNGIWCDYCETNEKVL